MTPATQSPNTSTQPARQQRILRLPEVKVKTGFGRSTICVLMASGEFLRSIRIGARAVAGLNRAIPNLLWWRVKCEHWVTDCPPLNG